MITVEADNKCPWCDTVFDRATGVETGPGPEPGDHTICIQCGEWSVFDNALQLRKPTDDEQIEIGLDPVCRQVRAAWVRAVQR